MGFLFLFFIFSLSYYCFYYLYSFKQCVCCVYVAGTTTYRFSSNNNSNYRENSLFSVVRFSVCLIESSSLRSFVCMDDSTTQLRRTETKYTKLENIFIENWVEWEIVYDMFTVLYIHIIFFSSLYVMNEKKEEEVEKKRSFSFGCLLYT